MTDEPLAYWIAVARLGFENDFQRIFDQSGISRAELAKRLKSTPAYVSKVLNSTDANFQLETMAKWARAIGAILQIRVTKEGEEVVRVVDYQTAREFDDWELPEKSFASSQPSPMGTVVSFRSRADLRSDAQRSDVSVAPPSGYASTGNG